MGRTGYLRGLDGIRALAVILILAYHYWPAGNRILKGGFIGVEIFFVISGFIITHILINEWDEKGSIDLKNFWMHRIRRLFPALVVLILAVIFSAAILPEISSSIESFGMPFFGKLLPDFENELASLKFQAITGFCYVINWYFIFHGSSYFEITDRPPLFGHLWSLSIEEQFYLFWPLVLIFLLKLGKGKKSFAITACLGIVAASATAMVFLGKDSPYDSRAYFGTDARIYSLILGSILAFIFGRIEEIANSSRIPKFVPDFLGAGSLAVILFLGFTLEGGEVMVFRGGLFLTSVAAIFLIISAVCFRSSLLGSLVFESSVAKFIGKRSYGLYLWHWPIFILTEPQYNYQVDGLVLMLIRLSTLFAITEISYCFIENPIRCGLIGKTISEIRAQSGWNRQKLVAKAGLTILFFTMLAGFCSISVLNFKSHGVPGLSQASASETEAYPVLYQSKPPFEIFNEMPQGFLSEEKNLIEPPSEKETMRQEEDAKGGFYEKKKNPEVLAIGDSVMLGAKKALESSIENIKVNAAVSRQFSEAYRIVKNLKKQGKLSKFVILHSGTNGTIKKEDLIGMMEELSGCSKVVVFNLRVPKKWQDSNNMIIESVVLKYPNAILVDWHGESSRQRGIFYKDGVHLKHPQGIALYASLAKKALGFEQKQ